jgi:hypothetical protein
LLRFPFVIEASFWKLNQRCSQHPTPWGIQFPLNTKILSFQVCHLKWNSTIQGSIFRQKETTAQIKTKQCFQSCYLINIQWHSNPWAKNIKIKLKTNTTPNLKHNLLITKKSPKSFASSSLLSSSNK